MDNKIRIVLKNKLALVSLISSILIIISLFLPIAISKGLEFISSSSQSNVWYWGTYEEQGQIFRYDVPFSLNILLCLIVLFLSLLIMVLSLQFGFDKIQKKLFGELLFLYFIFTYLLEIVILKLIEFSFSVLSDLEPLLSRRAPFWLFRIPSFGLIGFIIGLILLAILSLISLNDSRKSFFYLEIIFLMWTLFFQLFLFI